MLGGCWLGAGRTGPEEVGDTGASQRYDTHDIHYRDTLNLLAVATYETGDEQEGDHAGETTRVANCSEGTVKGCYNQETPDDSEENRAMPHEDFEVRIVKHQTV